MKLISGFILGTFGLKMKITHTSEITLYLTIISETICKGTGLKMHSCLKLHCKRNSCRSFLLMCIRVKQIIKRKHCRMGTSIQIVEWMEADLNASF